LDQSTKKRIKIEFPDITHMLGGEIKFNDTNDEESFHQKDLIPLFPYGISVAPDLKNTFFFLKDKEQNLTLPVLVNPIEASLILAQLNLAPDMQLAQPHTALSTMLRTLGVGLLQCVFVQTKGNRQLVRLYFDGHKSASSIKIYADQAMSVCIALRVPIYATLSFINQSKVAQVQIEGLTKNLLENQKLLLKNTTYLQ
jgi:uncharacterized protein